MNSALHSVFRLLQLHYPHLQQEQREDPLGELEQKRRRSPSYRGSTHISDHRTSELESVDERHKNDAKDEEMTMGLCGSEGTTVTRQSHDQLPSSCDTKDSMDDVSYAEPDFITVAYQVIDFISPSVNDVHLKATHPDVLFPRTHSTSANVSAC